jgi:hypothetical protein
VHGRSESGRRLTTTVLRWSAGHSVRGRLPGAVAAVVVVVCLLGGAASADAQQDSVLVVGVAASVYRPADEALDNPWGVGLVMRLRRHSGFGATIGLNWFRADVHHDVGGQRAQLGTLLVRPLMVGVTYTRLHAKFALSGSFVVGRAFNGLRHTGGASDVFAALGQPGTTFDVTDCLAYRPSFSIWWDLGKRFGLLTSVSYFVARPEIVTTTPSAGVFRRTVNTSSPLLTVGIGYGIF